jgi:hypothetical protein
MRAIINALRIIPAILAASALTAASVHAEPNGAVMSPTIQVDDGAGGWKPYDPQPLPPITKPLKPHKRTPKPIRHVTRNGWTYYLQEDRDTHQQFIQIEDANGADVHVDGDIPMPGAGPGAPLLPVR